MRAEMDKPLQEHVTRLEQRIESLRRQLAEPTGKSIESQSDLRIDLGLAERALGYFHRAYELERKISN
jgi:hypothetical protein